MDQERSANGRFAKPGQKTENPFPFPFDKVHPLDQEPAPYWGALPFTTDVDVADYEARLGRAVIKALQKAYGRASHGDYGCYLLQAQTDLAAIMPCILDTMRTREAQNVAYALELSQALIGFIAEEEILQEIALHKPPKP